MEGFKNTTISVNTKTWKEFKKLTREKGMMLASQLELLLQEFIGKNKGKKNGK